MKPKEIDVTDRRFVYVSLCSFENEAVISSVPNDLGKAENFSWFHGCEPGVTHAVLQIHHYQFPYMIIIIGCDGSTHQYLSSGQPDVTFFNMHPCVQIGNR